ncbi:hypothetical protein [Flavobacterium sp. FlaQc-47]|uniref:hypothetical protein n=1 Tax=Flavobacterium sp. FlaQc-47 TaxID=3374180 RepID=UPI003756CB90
MTLADLIKDFIDTTKERLKTPISGAFLWSFIIFNWRPIVLLLFSNTSIENKIIVINHEYCNFWALFFPFFIALFYTILVPKLMLQIDKSLIETKEERINNIYLEKEHLVDKKTTLASKEFLLKSAESGNKEIQELLDQIESLKQHNFSLQESIKQINDSNKNTIEELNKRLKISNDSLIELQRNYSNTTKLIEKDRKKYDDLHNTIVGDTLHLQKSLATSILKAGDSLTFDEYLLLKTIEAKEEESVFFGNSAIGFRLLHDMSVKGILHYTISEEGREVVFTQTGFILADIIKSS